MKKGKRIFNNDNMFIYLGTVIFFILAIGLGIIMYMMTKTNTKVENDTSEISQEIQTEGNTESVTTEIGKTVKEQENIKNETVENIAPSNAEAEKNKEETNVISDELEKSNIPNTTAEIKETKKEITFAMPVNGEIICEYAKDNLIYSETLKEWITHTAIDIKADKTSVIKSAEAGIVKSILNDPRYGLTVIIEHDEGYETVYSNLLTAEFIVEGEEVEQGQTIGTAGNTAAFESAMECHLHFELLKDGESLDPSIYLK